MAAGLGGGESEKTLEELQYVVVVIINVIDHV